MHITKRFKSKELLLQIEKPFKSHQQKQQRHLMLSLRVVGNVPAAESAEAVMAVEEILEKTQTIRQLQ